ncbi:MAG: HNH endonuclease [Pseudomonadota bacterium]
MHLSDEEIRSAAFTRTRRLEGIYGDSIPWAEIEKGITVNGQMIRLASKAEGIFKPKECALGALSIKTTVPRKGRYNIYEDKESDDGYFHYALKEGGNLSNNRYLEQCRQYQLPVIYFIGVAPGVYKAVYPCFIDTIDTTSGFALVSPGVHIESYEAGSEASAKRPPRNIIERRYAVREVKARLHQASFRDMVLTTYHHKCAISGLPVPELLEAAHIIPDAHDLGAAEIQNGICLSRLHHRAFDAMLIGIRPDYTLIVSEKLKAMNDGPILEEGLKKMDGKKIWVPGIDELKPSKLHLEMRWADFEGAN